MTRSILVCSMQEDDLTLAELHSIVASQSDRTIAPPPIWLADAPEMEAMGFEPDSSKIGSVTHLRIVDNEAIVADFAECPENVADELAAGLLRCEAQVTRGVLAGALTLWPAVVSRVDIRYTKGAERLERGRRLHRYES